MLLSEEGSAQSRADEPIEQAGFARPSGPARRALRSWSLPILSAAYFYSGPMPIPRLLTFSGAVLAGQPLVETLP